MVRLSFSDLHKRLYIRFIFKQGFFILFYLFYFFFYTCISLSRSFFFFYIYVFVILSMYRELRPKNKGKLIDLCSSFHVEKSRKFEYIFFYFNSARSVSHKGGRIELSTIISKIKLMMLN